MMRQYPRVPAAASACRWAGRRRAGGLVLGVLLAVPCGAATLWEAVQAGLAQDPQVHGASSAAQRAQAELDVARGGRFPVFSANAGTIGSGGATYTATLTHKLYDWGQTSYRIEAASALARAEAGGLTRAREEVAFNIVTVYLDVLTLESRATTTRTQIERLRALVSLAQARVEGGYSDLSEFGRAASELTRVQDQLVQVESQLRAARLQYAELTGATPQMLTWPVLANFLGRDEDVQRLDGLVETAPTVQQLKAEWEAQKARADEADVAMRPQLAFQASRTRSQVGGRLYDDSSVGVLLTIDAIQGLSAVDRARAERLRQESAADKSRQVQRELRRKSLSLVENAAAARAREPLLRVRVAQLGELTAVYETQFQAGRRGFNELLSLSMDRFDAERQLLEVRDQATRVLLDLAARLGQLVPWLQDQAAAAR